MITTTTKVAKKIIEKTGKGRTIFNDKLVDGRRSLKVWGWGESEYLKAKKKLEKKGCVVRVITIKRRVPAWSLKPTAGSKFQIRLHVAEPSCN